MERFENFVTPGEAQGRACYQRSGSEKPFACLGPLCMAWRWNAGVDAGYCGMAGRPLNRSEFEMIAAVINDAMFGERGPEPELLAFDLAPAS